MLDIFDAAEKYKSEGRQLVIIGGKEYGSGSSRDWAAKGPYLQGIRPGRARLGGVETEPRAGGEVGLEDLAILLVGDRRGRGFRIGRLGR